jgi:hypothetical protein
MEFSLDLRDEVVYIGTGKRLKSYSVSLRLYRQFFSVDLDFILESSVFLKSEFLMVTDLQKHL